MCDELSAQLLKQKMKVDFNSYDLSVKELISMIEDNLMDIAPDYQRKFRWDTKRQSSLIESLYLGIPVPAIFTATNADGTWELIDGVQRVSTILCFAGSDVDRAKINLDSIEPLKLCDLKKLSAFNGKFYTELPVALQIKFKLTSLKVITLSDKSDKCVRFDLFERLNKGGISLSDQEIRSCVYRGGFSDFIKELSLYSSFRQCVHLSERQEIDGTREELVLRFFAYLYDINSFSHSVKDFLNTYMEKNYKSFKYSKYSKDEELFRYVFDTIYSALPMGITKGRKNTPLNLFEAISVGAAQAYLNKGKINTEGIEDWITDPELLKNITGATNSRPRVLGRIEFCRKKFER